MVMNYSIEQIKNYITDAVEEFYELVYKDPWFSKIFRNIEQEVITSQQIDFMLQSFGGPKNFCGRNPKDAHPHIWVDEDIWNYREMLLQRAFDKVNTPQDIQEKWLRIDNAFKNVIINKKDPAECVGRYKTDEIIIEFMPDYLKKKAA